MPSLVWYTKILFLLFIAAQVHSQAQRAVEKLFSPPLQPGDVIVITGTGFTRSVGQIRLHSVRGSCDTRPVSRSASRYNRLTCNPLVIKLRARKHQATIFKKDMENDNRDTVIQRGIHFPQLREGEPFTITITVTYRGFEVELNDQDPLVFVTNGKVGRVTRIRAASGIFHDIVLKPAAKMELNERDCGLQGSASYFNSWLRITKGEVAKAGAYPWQAALRKKQVFSWHPYAHMCGATLISKCWVITAGHCLTSVIRFKNKYVIRVGDYHNGEGQDNRDDEDQQDFDIEEIYVHHGFNQSGPVPLNDIAMIKLKEKDGECARYSQYVKPACLPEPIEDYFPDNIECHVSGWGAKNWTDRPQEYPQILRYGKVNLINFFQCRNMYGKKNNVTLIQDGMLCAGSHGVDTCHGDSGGPLVCQKNGRGVGRAHPFILWGVTSWGHGCGDIRKPGVYAAVVDYIDWIRDVKRRYSEGISGTRPTR